MWSSLLLSSLHASLVSAANSSDLSLALPVAPPLFKDSNNEEESARLSSLFNIVMATRTVSSGAKVAEVHSDAWQPARRLIDKVGRQRAVPSRPGLSFSSRVRVVWSRED